MKFELYYGLMFCFIFFSRSKVHKCSKSYSNGLFKRYPKKKKIPQIENKPGCVMSCFGSRLYSNSTPLN